mmetsp:Transcript_458/g.804  ORF Transcript_458/g.804 Transcript_458/m.804 type:complete len:497 (+) Transcript_458:393-1883(+)
MELMVPALEVDLSAPLLPAVKPTIVNNVVAIDPDMGAIIRRGAEVVLALLIDVDVAAPDARHAVIGEVLESSLLAEGVGVAVVDIGGNDLGAGLTSRDVRHGARILVVGQEVELGLEPGLNIGNFNSLQRMVGHTLGVGIDVGVGAIDGTVEVAAAALVGSAAEQALRAEHGVVVAALLSGGGLSQGAGAGPLVTNLLGGEDLLPSPILVASSAVTADDTGESHVEALLALAVVVGAILKGAIAVGDVQVLDILPAAQNAVVHVVLAALLMLIVLHIIASSIVANGQVAMVGGVDLLDHVRDLAVASTHVNSALVAPTAVLRVGPAVASANSLVAHLAELLEVGVGVQDLLLGEGVAIPGTRAGQKLVAIPFLIPESNSPRDVDDVAGGVEVLRGTRQAVALHTLAVEVPGGVVVLGVEEVVLLVPGQGVDFPLVTPLRQEDDGASVMLVLQVRVGVAELTPGVADLASPLVVDALAPLAILLGNCVPLVPQLAVA